MADHVVAPPLALGVAGRFASVRAGPGERLQRVGHLVAVRRVAVPRLQGDELADLVADELTRERDARIEAPHRADLQHEPARAHFVPQRQTFGGPSPERLLDKHVLARRDRRSRGGDVVLIGGRDQHRVEVGIGEHRRIVGEGAPGPVDGVHLGEQVLGDVADRVELRVARLVERLEMGELGDRSGAEDADVQLPLLLSAHRAFSSRSGWVIGLPPGVRGRGSRTAVRSEGSRDP